MHSKDASGSAVIADRLCPAQYEVYGRSAVFSRMQHCLERACVETSLDYSRQCRHVLKVTQVQFGSHVYCCFVQFGYFFVLCNLCILLFCAICNR